MYFISRCLLLITLCITNPFAYCGDITISYSPPSLRFGTADSLHVSDLDDVFASALGYTPNNFPLWRGMTVTSAFDYPLAAVFFVVKDAGVSFRMEGTSYELKEDIPFTDSYQMLISLIGARARRAVHFEKVDAIELVNKYTETFPIPKTQSLKEKDPMVSLFLQEMSALPSVADYMENPSSKPDGGQDVVYVEIDTFAPLVKEFGANSDEVEEASQILRSSLVQAIGRMRKFYVDRVVIATVKLSEEKTLIRTVRDAPFGPDSNSTGPINLAAEYSDDYPVIFNIVVILSIILIVAIIATSVSMAFMDPGRDSIIYRMTNPRMKKDQ